MGKNKNYRIIVQGQQNTSALLPLESHEYYIQGENMNQAQEQALAIYRKSFPDALNVTAAKKSRMKTAAIIFMSISCFLSFIPWYLGPITLSLQPSLFTIMLAIGFYSAVIIRLKGLHNSFNNATDTILSILTILLCASFLNFFIGDVDIQIFWFNIFVSGKILLTAAFLLSWLGVALVAKFVWIALFVLAAARIMVGDAAMGFWGVVYVLSAFLGIIFQLKQESAGFRESLGREIVSIGARTSHRIFRDINTVSAPAKVPDNAHNTNNADNAAEKEKEGA